MGQCIVTSKCGSPMAVVIYSVREDESRPGKKRTYPSKSVILEHGFSVSSIGHFGGGHVKVVQASRMSKYEKSVIVEYKKDMEI